MTSLQAQSSCDSAGPLTLSGPARDWQFLDAVGPHAGLLGREDGTFEAWVYPLKLFRDFHLAFRLGDRVIAAESLPHSITSRPESVSIRYVHDAFTACVTWFVPIDEPGAVVTVAVDSFDPVQVQATFTPDVAWMWPAGMGDAYSQWDAAAQAFRFGSDQHRFFAIAGAQGASGVTTAYSTNFAAERSDAFNFGPAAKGSTTYRFAMAASFESKEQADAVYHKLLAGADALEQEARRHYQHYLDRTVRLSLPDRQLQAAYDWSRISTLQGLVDQPFAGNGLVAGYNISSGTHRPGFSWYFGRDSMWTALALNSIGDFSTARAALEFLQKYQRPDGRIPHEIAQTVKLVDWWNAYPYGTASADGTPLYLIGFEDYVRASGDVAFAREHWDSLWRAYQFLKSTYGPSGVSRNLNVGHGWIEGGPLRPQPNEQYETGGSTVVPISGELYQAGVGIAAVEALASLARMTGKNDVAQPLSQEAAAQRATLEKLFWSPQKTFYAFALDLEGNRIDKPSVLGTVPMWFGLLEAPHAQLFLDHLTGPDHQADWGMRIISENNPLYSPSGYHYGSVWPLFTGWASVAEYRYHRALPAYLNLMANAQLTHDGTPGRATEVLSGRYYTQLDTSTPHQIWSSAMVLSPLLRGLMGLEVDAVRSQVTFAPHVPAGWNDFAVDNVHVGETALDFLYRRAAEEITLEITRHGSANVQVEFSPAFSLRAKVLDVDVNGHRIEAKVPSNENDQHATVSVPISSDKTTIHLRVRGDLRIAYPYAVPDLGATSSGLRIISEQWNASRDQLELQVAGSNGASYQVPLFGDLQGLAVTGAEWKGDSKQGSLTLEFPAGPAGAFSTRTVSLRFATR